MKNYQKIKEVLLVLGGLNRALFAGTGGNMPADWWTDEYTKQKEKFMELMTQEAKDLIELLFQTGCFNAVVHGENGAFMDMEINEVFFGHNGGIITGYCDSPKVVSAFSGDAKAMKKFLENLTNGYFEIEVKEKNRPI